MRILTIFAIITRNIEMALRDLFKLSPRPYKVLLELTDYCNSKCKTCFIWKNTADIKNQLKTVDLRPALKEYGSNFLWVALGGGEITLYAEFDQLVEDLKTYCPNLRIVTFTTNGLKPEKALDYAIKLKKSGYDLFITISRDGDEEYHDYIRGVIGNHELALQTMKLLKENNIWTHFGLTVSHLNSDYISENLKEDIHLTRAFSFEHNKGIYKTNYDISSGAILASIKKVKQLYKIQQLSEIVEYIYISLAEIFFKQNKKHISIPCEVISSSLHIRSNGDVVPCMYLPAIGNIKENNLVANLKSKEASGLRQKALSGSCEKCWMNCYAPHSIMRHPLLSLKKLFFT